MPKRNIYSNWAKSFGKSVKFGAKEILSEMAPSMAETTNSMAEEMRELRQDLRALRSNKRQIANYLLGEEENFSKYGSTIVKNAKSAVRTGKFIDPKREDKMIMKAMGMDDLDLDFDGMDDSGGGEDSFDMNADAAFGGGDDDLGSFGDVEMGPTKVVNVMGPSNKAIETLSEQISTTNKAVAGGFARMSKANVHAFTISEAMEKKFHSEKMAQFQSINTNLANIIEYNNETISTYVKASMEFYDKNIELLTSINAAMLRVSPEPETQEEQKRLESPVDAFMSGGFSIKGYSSIVAKNAKRMFSNSMVGSMLPMLNNDMMMSSIAANPLGFFLKEGISALIPDRFKKSLEGLDKSYKHFIPAALTKLQRYNGDNPIIEFMGQLFGIKTSIEDRDFRPGEYQKGPIPFDGETKNAVIRVIPGYLARQTAVLETIASRMLKGDDDKLEENIQNRIISYNFDSSSKSHGMFMRRSEAIKMRKREEREKIANAYTDSRWDLEEILSEYKDVNGKVRDRSEDIMDFVVGLTYLDEEWHPGDIDQTKRVLYMGSHNGKEPNTDDYLKDPNLEEKAQALKYGFSKMAKSSKLAMYGTERHEARINLSNMNRFYGSDAEHGVGAGEFASVISKGSIADLYTERGRKKAITLSTKYRLIKNDKGKYEIPADMLKLYNKENGKGGKYLNEFKNAKEVYEDMVVNHPEYLTAYDKDNKEFPPPASTPAEAAKATEVPTGSAPTEAPVVQDSGSITQSLLDKYKITQTPKGGWTMPKDMREQYNAEHGTDFKRADAVYKDIMKNGVAKPTTEAAQNVVGKPSTSGGEGAGTKQSYKDILIERYQLTQGTDGKWTMPESMRQKYNQDFDTKFRNANTVYKDILKRDKQAKKRKAAEESETDELAKSTTGTLTAKLKSLLEYPFNKIADVFDKVNEVMHDIIFGKDGLGGNLKEMILGKYDEAKGVYTGGMFSEAVTSVKGVYTGAKEYLFGNDKKPGILSNATKKLKDIMDEYFTGKPEIGKDGKPITVIDKIKSTLVNGANDLADTLFGKSKEGGKGKKRSIDEAREMFNKAMPDMGKGAGIGAIVGTVTGLGGFGLMGSLFLPGGPIGGAVVGAAAGFLKQSKSFREMMFGKEVKGKDGKIHRVGGLFSEKMQNFMKAKKVPIIGGATMGVISSLTGHGIAFGLMPSLVVGAFGPVIAGAAWGLLSHSRTFRNLIFGKQITGKDGVVRRIGGLLNNRLMAGFKSTLPRAVIGAIGGIGSMGIISQLGIVGNMIALGPIPAAIAGAGVGIASASKDFTRALFGYTDKSGKYHSGAMDKVKNFFTVEIFEPLKLKISKELFEARFWIRKNVFGTLRKAFAPFREAVLEVAESVRKEFSEALHPIKEGFKNIFVTIGETLRDVFKPVISVVRTMSNFMLDRFKDAVQISINTALLPLRAAGGLIKMILNGRDYKSTVTDAWSGVTKAMSTGTGLLGAVGNLGSAIFNPKLKRFEEEEKHNKFMERIEAKAHAKGSSFYEAKHNELKALQKKVREGGYALTDEQVEAMKAAEADVDVMDTAAKSEDTSIQLERIQVEQGAKIAMHVENIDKNTSAANEANNVVTEDDNHSEVDRKNQEKKAEAEKEKKVEERENKRDKMWKRMLDFFTKKKEKGGWFWKIAGTIGSIASGILGVISTVGEIGGTLLGIYGILKMAFGDKSEGGTSQKIGHSQAMGNLVERGVKATAFGINRHGATIRNGARAIGGAVKEIGSAGWQKLKGIGRAINGIKEVGYLKTMGRNFAEGTGISNLVAKVVEKSGKIAEGITSSLGGLANSSLVKALFGSADKPGLFKKFIKMLASLGKALSNKSIVEALAKRLPSKMSKALLRTGIASTGYGLILTAGFAVYDIASGAMNADRMFDVNPEDVTITMRMISSFVNTILGLPFMGFVDLVLTGAAIGLVALSTTDFGKAAANFGLDLSDIDPRKTIAKFLLRFISSDEDNAKTAAAQKKFDDEYKAYLDEKGLQPSELSKEQYREKMGNKTFWQRFGAPILDKMMGIENSEKTPSFRERVNDEFERLVKWFKDSVKAIMDFHPIDYVKGKLDEFFKPIGDRLDNIGKRWNELTSTPLLTDEGQKKGSSTWEKFKASLVARFKRNQPENDDEFAGSGNGFYQSQNDARWKNLPFGGSTYGDMMCGPAVGAMIGRMAGRDVDVKDTVALMQPGHLEPGAKGVKSDYFRAAANAYGMGYKEETKPSGLIESLANGASVAVGGRSTNPNSPFYGSGHYVLAKGISPDGKVNIYNPTSKDKNTTMDVADLVHQSIGTGGYAGSFIGGGRLFKLDNSVSAQLDNFNARNRARNGAWTPEKGKIAAKYQASERRRLANKGKGRKSTKPKKMGLTGLLTGVGLAVKNLFSSVWNNSKYEFVNESDILGGITSFFKGGKGDTIRNSGTAEYKQDDERWWDHPYTFSTVAIGGCMPTTFCNMASMYGVKVLPPEACDFAGSNGMHVQGGTALSFFPAAAAKWNVPVHACGSWDEVMEDLNTGHPVAAGFEGGDGWSTGGHWMLMTKMDDNGNIYIVDTRRGVHDTGADISGWHTNQETFAHWAGPGYAFGADEVPRGGGGGSFDSSSGRIETKKAVWNYLVNDMNINRAGAAGIMGNIEQESGFRTEAYNANDNDGQPSGGLVQWHAGRFNNLKAYADSIGRPWEDVEAQMGYLNEELNNAYKTRVYDQIQDAPSVADAVDTWVRKFEIPADIPGEIARRTPMAQSYYDNTTDFVGGANGFANPISSLLTDWGNRYIARGRAKRLGIEQAARQYAAQTPARTRFYSGPTTPVPASATVLPAKVDTGGATMDDLLLSIRALDSHNELNQIIAYLAAIAANGGNGRFAPGVTRTDADRQNMQRYLDKAKLETRAEAARNRLGPERFKDLMNTMDAMGNLSRDQMDIALDIAKGGNFRNS